MEFVNGFIVNEKNLPIPGNLAWTGPYLLDRLHASGFHGQIRNAHGGVVQTRIADEIPEQNKFYDPDNPDYQKLQKANESLIGFPLDKKGYVD